MQNNSTIDIVITWVDGNDPLHQQKMQNYLSSSQQISDDINGPTRFRCEGEIMYCVASILRFAPFVRKVFIVTDNQDPHIDKFIKLNFPENKIPIEIIDTK
jgi:hypothetical protein